MAEGGNKLWVDVLRAKYCGNHSFWEVAHAVGETPLWRVMLDLRNFFHDHVIWSLGDGQDVSAVGQPWFTDWSQGQSSAAEHAHLKVADLTSPEGSQWNRHQLEGIFGVEIATKIVQEVKPPVPDSIIRDRLIWDGAKSGRYTAKEGYTSLIKRAEHQQTENPVWALIWNKIRVIPKVKTFLWRACHNGLATSQVLHRRIAAIEPRCQRCGEESEYLTHLIFFCAGSRAVWFASNLNLRVDDIPMEFQEALLFLTTKIDSGQWPLLCNLMWSIWKARNKAVIERKAFQPLAVVRQAQAMTMVEAPVHTAPALEAIDIPQGVQVIITDASWDQTEKAGVASVHFDECGRLTTIRYSSSKQPDPTISEARAIWEALKGWDQGPRRGRRVWIFSDCKAILEGIKTGAVENLPSWRAAQVVLEIRRKLADMDGVCQIHYARREFVAPAHALANVARRTGQTFSGVPVQTFLESHQIQMKLCEDHFKHTSSAVHSHSIGLGVD